MNVNSRVVSLQVYVIQTT